MGYFAGKLLGQLSHWRHLQAACNEIHLNTSFPALYSLCMWSPCPSLLPLFILRENSLLCISSADLRCVSRLLGQALPRVSKAQIRDSIWTSFSLMSSSSSSCFGKAAPMLSREFCRGHGEGVTDRRMRAGWAHTAMQLSLPLQSAHTSPRAQLWCCWQPAKGTAGSVAWTQTCACATRVPLPELQWSAHTEHEHSTQQQEVACQEVTGQW